MMTWMYGYSWPMMLGMVLWWLFWIALVSIGIWMLVRWMRRSSINNSDMYVPSEELSPIEILSRRYARGEIDTMTFEQMREHLETEREQPVK